MTGSSVKKLVHIEPTRFVTVSIPASAAAFDKPFTKTRGALFEFLINGFVAEAPQGQQSRRHRQRISGERARLIDGSDGRDVAHQLATAAICAHRQAAANYFPEAGDVGRHAVKFLRAAASYAKSGHHFIEDQQRAVSCC